MKRLSVVAVAVLVAFSMVSCTPLEKAQGFANVLSATLDVAQVEAPNVPPADQPVYNAFVALGQSLVSQLQACIVSANSGMVKSGKFLACFNGFATGLASPAELAQLRILSDKSRGKVQLYLTGLVAGVNIAVREFGGHKLTAPAVGPTPSAAEFHELEIRVRSERGL